MTRKKKKIRVDRLIILILSAVLFVSLLTFGIYSLINVLTNKGSNKPNKTEYVDPDPVDTTQGIKVELVDYENYVDDTNKLGFNFVLANFKFSSNNPISFDLNNLQTSEKIHLNNVSKQLNTLEMEGYKTSKLNVVTEVVSQNNEYICKLFIPYTTKDAALRVTNAVDQSMITFDLTSVNNRHYVTELRFDTSQNIDVNNTSVNVSSSFISTMMLHNGQEYEVASTLRVFTFKINVKEIEGNVMITDAKFVKDGSSEEIPCMSAEYSSEKVKNVLNKKLELGDKNGALFFETESKGERPDYSGTLFLMFSNSSDWVKVPTSLE